VAQLRRDNSVMDVAYGPAFALCYWGAWYLTDMPTGTPVLIGALVSVWALRLAIRIGRKNWGSPEDARYAAWRKDWSEKGALYFVLRSYIQINLLQGIIIFLVAAPLWYLLALKSVPGTFALYTGVALMLFGLLYETIADWQLDRFIAQKKAGATDKILMTSGLFSLSRRPNYFGESLVWWGFALMAISAEGWFTLIAPLVITYILVRVTGPMLERIFIQKYPEAYQAYMERVPNMLIPRP
jgi:steroid 5-alpha reductase family enzyme